MSTRDWIEDQRKAPSPIKQWSEEREVIATLTARVAELEELLSVRTENGVRDAVVRARYRTALEVWDKISKALGCDECIGIPTKALGGEAKMEGQSESLRD